MRAIPLKGAVGYQEIISRAEELQLNEELLKALQDPRAAYIMTEARYCVTLYERALGIPGGECLAFGLAETSPTLYKLFQRLYQLELIPALPNLCQVSEMIGNFSGYPVQSRPEAIGSYCGIINLISPTVMHLQHKSCPWYPRLYLSPRSLTVITDPCLSDFKMGYKQTHQPFHSFEYGNRVSQDYRLELMFATVEEEHLTCLNESVCLTDYANEKSAPANQRRISGGGASTESQKEAGARDTPSSFISTTESWIKKLKGRMSQEGATGEPVDGLRLRQEAKEERLVGRQRGPHEEEDSFLAKRRLKALKARYDLAALMKKGKEVSRDTLASSPSPHVIVNPPRGR